MPLTGFPSRIERTFDTSHRAVLVFRPHGIEQEFD